LNASIIKGFGWKNGSIDASIGVFFELAVAALFPPYIDYMMSYNTFLSPAADAVSGSVFLCIDNLLLARVLGGGELAREI